MPKGTVMVGEPHIRIFHPSFAPLVPTNFRGAAMKSAPSTIKFRLQDQAITLEPFHGSPAQYEEKMEGLITSLNFFGMHLTFTRLTGVIGRMFRGC